MSNSSHTAFSCDRQWVKRLQIRLHPYRAVLRRIGVAALFFAVGAVGLAFAIGSENSVISYRLWGLVTSAAAGLAVLSLVALDGLHRATSRARRWVYGVFLLVAGVVPALWGVALRWHMGCPLVSQECGANMETSVVERAGQLLLRTGSPYIDIAQLPDPQVSDYNPYSPLMSVFGLPAGYWGTHWWTDARLYFLVVTVLVLLGAWHLARRPLLPESAFLLLIAATPVTMNFVASGIDMAVVALLVLCVVAAFRDVPVLAALAGAVALGMKLTALPVLVVVAIALVYRAWRWHKVRVAVLFLLVGMLGTVAAYVPFYLAHPGAMVENIVRYTTGSSIVESSAQGATPGQLIAATGVTGVWVARVLLVLAAVAMVVWMVKRPPVAPRQAFWVCAVGLFAAMMVMPASRFGYLVYPAVLAAAALVSPAASPRCTAESAREPAREPVEETQGEPVGETTREAPPQLPTI